MKVSIIMTSKNEGERIRYALEFWLNQSYKNFEIIVVDDSDDYTPEIVKEYMDKYRTIKLIKGEGKGVGAARNLGFKHAKGEIVIWSDADGLPVLDELKQLGQFNYLESVIEGFKKEQNIDVMFSDYKILFTKNLLGNVLSIYDTGIRYKAIDHMAEAYRKSIFKENPIKEGLTVGEDKDFFENAMENARMIGITKVPRVMVSGVYTWKEFIARYLWYGSKSLDMIKIRKSVKDLINPVVCFFAFVSLALLPLSVLYNILFITPFFSLIVLEYLRETKIFRMLLQERQIIAYILEPFVVYFARLIFTIGFFSSLFGVRRK